MESKKYSIDVSKILNRKVKVRPIEYYVNENGCWICTSHYCTNKKYPKIRLGNKGFIISRLITKYIKKEDIENKYVCHTCDNRMCINPEHLFIGTALDNTTDMFNKNRNVTTKGMNYNSCVNNGRAKLTADDVLRIFNSSLKNSDLAKKYNVSTATISSIKNKKRWREMTND